MTGGKGLPRPWCAYLDGVVVPGVATVRLLDDVGQVKVRRGPRATREVRRLAFSAGMTVKTFNALPGVDKAKVRWAFLLITAPSNVGREPDPVDWDAALAIGNRSL